MEALTKKVILVTGASSGIGHDTVLRLLKDGHIVYGTVRSVQGVRELAKAGGKIIPLDITQEKNIEKTIEKIIEEAGRLDVLVNNAGYALYGSVEETPLEEARHQFEVNVFGLAKITQCVIPHMRNRGAGKIINISSVGGKIAFPLGAWYHASKHALEGWSDSLRGELRDMNIQVIIVEPGFIQTPLGNKMYESIMLNSSKGVYKKLTKNIVAGLKILYFSHNASSPRVVSETILKILVLKNPRTRYRVGKYSQIFIWIHRILGDKLFEGLFLGTSKWEHRIMKLFGLGK